LVIVFLIVFGQGLTSASLFNSRSSQWISGGPSKKLVTINIKYLNMDAAIAKTASERKKGLSGRDSLPLNQGVLFVFEQSGTYGFWMKDMKFAIDILWLDESKKIVDIAQSVPTEPDKKDKEFTIYKPSQNAKYVLEINAGLSQLHGLQIGDQANFEL
jgi:hypothetical protein